MPGPRVFLTADATSLAVERSGTVLADGHLRRARTGWILDVTERAGVAAGHEEVAALLGGLIEVANRAGGGPVQWRVRDPTPTDDDTARGAGLGDVRDLLQLRRPLPVGTAARAGVPAIATRPFRPGTDDERWLEVNNRAFADHPDQGGQTATDLDRLVHEPWFDANGFLLLDADPAGARSGRLDGFCWTKVHADHDPPLGEIFVIGVDPAAGGKGLGKALTLAGLDHLVRSGLDVGMLYVDVDNTGAMALYEHLGFTPHHLDRMYQGVA